MLESALEVNIDIYNITEYTFSNRDSLSII